MATAASVPPRTVSHGRSPTCQATPAAAPASRTKAETNIATMGLSRCAGPSVTVCAGGRAR